MLTRRALHLALAGGALAALTPETTMSADTAPIREGFFADINGLPQWLTIRGDSPANPALLMLHGGPGIPMSFMAPVFAEWEKHFTLVQWDQPGGGATWSKTPEGQGPLTIDRYVRDGLAVAELVRSRLGKAKLALFGISWGTRLGMTMVRARPDLFSAYYGTAQVVSGPRGGPVGFNLALSAARARGDLAAVEALTKVGPGPYATMEQFFIRQQYTNPPGQPSSAAEQAAGAAMMATLQSPQSDTSYLAQGLPPQNGPAVFLATQGAVFAEAWSWDIASLGQRFDVPIHVIQGSEDWNTPVELAREWIASIEAPAKAFATIPGASHSTIAFHRELLAFIRAHDVRA